jgi:hypothetical protein
MQGLLSRPHFRGMSFDSCLFVTCYIDFVPRASSKIYLDFQSLICYKRLSRAETLRETLTGEAAEQNS